jgi:hypothetical protein
VLLFSVSSGWLGDGRGIRANPGDEFEPKAKIVQNALFGHDFEALRAQICAVSP